VTAAHYAGLSRIPLALAAAYSILEVPDGGRELAAGIVLIAGITDLLDGLLARRQGTVSVFGGILDLTTDKVFTLPVLFLTVRADSGLLWLAIVIMIRDLLVMGLRVFAAIERVEVSSSRTGKLKSLALYLSLGFLLLDLPGGSALLALAAVGAVVSALAYGRSSWPVLGPQLRQRAERGPGDNHRSDS
jgi:CDP-diacylglycerol--glycerol-3-phosphate 3-phosphatidyltransferase